MQARGRRSIRLPDYDYSSPGAYFATISTKLRQPLFGRQHGGDVVLNDYGRVATQCWQELPKHFSQLIIDAFIVMPNHVHGILFIHEGDIAGVGAQHAAPLRKDKFQVGAGSLGAIVRSYKAAVSREIHKLTNDSMVVWHRNYFERVIREERELDEARNYILHNPLKEK